MVMNHVFNETAVRKITEQPCLVSVLIGTRDRFQPLLRCLDSVLSQNYSRLEVLVLDDCSRKYDICDIMPRHINDHRVKCFRSDRQLGVAGGRNFLMQKANGEVFVIIDDDAYFADNDCIFRFIDTFSTDERLGIIASKIIDHRKNQEALLVPFSRQWCKKRPDITKGPRVVSYFLGGCHAIRRQVIEKCGFYQDDMAFGEEELDLSYRAVEKGFKILYLPSVVIHHEPQASVVGQPGHRRRTELYYHTRNRFFLAYKYLPWVYVPVYLSIWLSVYGLSALRQLAFREFLSGIVSGVKGLRNLKRTPLSRQAVRYLKAHYGRLWY